MLPPVSAISTASASLAQRDVPVVAQQVLASLATTPDAAVALSLAANSEVEGKLNMLLIGARERMIDSLFAVVDAVSQALAMQPAAGETNVGYALRLASAVNDLPPSQVASVQQDLNAQGQTAPLALIARALQNPAGNEAAQVVAYMEVVRYKEKDLATKAVVASYGQNGGEEPDEARLLTTTAQAAAEGGVVGQPKSPVAAGSTAQAAPALPPAPEEEPTQAASAPKPSSPATLPQSSAPSPQTASSAQVVATPAKLPTSTAPALPQAAASTPTPNVPTAETNATPLSAPAPQLTDPSRQAATTPASALPQGELASTTLARAADAIIAKPEEAPQSAPNPLAASLTTGISPRTPQALTTAPLASQPTNTTPVQPPQTKTLSPSVPVAPLASFEAAALLPAAVAAMVDEIESFAQLLPQPVAIEEHAAPLLQQPQSVPIGQPTQPMANGQIPQDIQAVLKVVVDRLVSATGVELLQTMAEVEPVAEKVVAQALVADMLDSAELGTLPSPDDAAIPAPGAQISQPAPTIQQNPAEETAPLAALNRLLTETAPIVQAMVQQQPLQPPLPVGVPFAIGQYLPAEDANDEIEALHIDRVDAVDDDDEEQEDQDSRQRWGEDGEAEEEQLEADDELPVAQYMFGEEGIVSEASDPRVQRPLALPRPAPIEPLRQSAFDLYQRMGGWD